MRIDLDHELDVAADDTHHPSRLGARALRRDAEAHRHRWWRRFVVAVACATLLASGGWWVSRYVTLTSGPAPTPSTTGSTRNDLNPAVLPLHPDGRYIDPGPFDSAVVSARCAIDPLALDGEIPAGTSIGDGTRTCSIGYDMAPMQVMPTWPMDDADVTEICTAAAGYDLSAFTLLGRETSEVPDTSEVAAFESTNGFVAMCSLVSAQVENIVEIHERAVFASAGWPQLQVVLVGEDSMHLAAAGVAGVVDETGDLDLGARRATLRLVNGSTPLAVDIHGGWIVANRAVALDEALTFDDLVGCTWTVTGPSISPRTYPCPF